MSGKVGICVIGLGVGASHANAYTTLKDSVNLSVCDANPERLKATVERLGAEGFSNYQEALERPDVHAVDICLPHHLHCSVAVESAQAGKHVIVEKPMARTLEEADAMLDAASKAGV